MYSGDKVYATFNNVTIGIDAVIFVEIYENAPTNTSQNLVYKGNSKIFTVESTAKTIAIDLVRIENQETPQKFTVTFDANGGSFADGNTTQQITVEEGTPVTAPEGTPTYHDKTFEYWAIQQEDDSFSEYDFSQPVTQNITLYAQWREVNQVSSVHFNPTTHTVDVGTEITLFCDTPNASIYYTTDDSTPTTSSNKYIAPITIRTETTIKAYAVKSGMLDSAVTQITYSLNQYTVQFVLNGGNFTENNKENPISVPSGTEVILKEYQVERSGYEFGGWYYDNEFTQPVDDSGIVTPSQINTTSDTLTLYAKWEVASYPSFTELKAAIADASASIHVAGNIEISETLTIGSTTTLIADAPTTFTRKDGFTGALFTNSADFTLQGSENARITIDGNDIEAEAPAIKSTGNLTLTYCNFENNINTSTDGGAIFVETTAEVTLSASNCNFTNNKVTVSVTAGGAVAIDGSKVNSTITKSNFINNLAENNGGGALYINGSSTTNYLHTISDSQFNDNKTEGYNTNYGGAIYLSQGNLELNNISMNDNRHYSSEDSYSSSDIFIYKNYTNVTLCGTIIINSLVDNFGSGTDNPVIKLENFSTESQIGVLCTAGSGASVDDGDPLITPNDGEVLTSEQIACFTSIEDSNGVQYTLNVDGTITPNN